MVGRQRGQKDKAGALTGPRRSMSSCRIWETRASFATRARCRRSLNSISSPCISATCNTQAPDGEARGKTLPTARPAFSKPTTGQLALRGCWAGNNECCFLRDQFWLVSGQIQQRKWQPTLVFLPGESHRQRSLAGHGPWGRRELDTTEASKHARVQMHLLS